MLDPKLAHADDRSVAATAPKIEPLSMLARDAAPPAAAGTAPDFFVERTVPVADPPSTRQAAADFHAEAPASRHAPAERPWLRHLISRSLSAGGLMVLGVIATLAWRSHGHEARQVLARWAPDAVLTWLPPTGADLPSQAPGPTEETTVAAVPADAPAAPVNPAQAAPQVVQAAPDTPAPPAADAALQAMARDLAKAQQAIEQLKDNQDKLVREVAKLSEQEARRRSAALQPRAVAPARKPVPPPLAGQPRSLSPPPPVAQAPAPSQPSSAPRPPAAMPAAQ